MRFREGDFLETVENLIFDVKGVCHPPDRVISYVRYVPDVKGDRKREGASYRKLYELEERDDFLKENFPQYVYFDPVFHRHLQGVPLSFVKKRFDPVEKLSELLNTRKNGLEDSTVQLAQLLDIPVKVIGVSGSVLVGLHTMASDIDLIVYGREYCLQAYDTLKNLRGKGVIHELDPERAKKKAEFRWGSATEELVKIEKKKILHGLFRGRDYFFRFLHSEYMEYGSAQYFPLSRATVRGKILDDGEALFTPCCYEVDSPVVSRIVSLRGRFCEQVKKGDIITAQGTVEKVVTRREGYYQLMLGDRDDYLIPE